MEDEKAILNQAENSGSLGIIQSKWERREAHSSNRREQRAEAKRFFEKSQRYMLILAGKYGDSESPYPERQQVVFR